MLKKVLILLAIIGASVPSISLAQTVGGSKPVGTTPGTVSAGDDFGVVFGRNYSKLTFNGAIGGYQDATTHTLISTYGSLAAAKTALGCTQATTGNETVDWCAIQGQINRGKTVASTGVQAGTSLFNGPKGVKIELPGRQAYYDMGCSPLVADDMSLDLEGSGTISTELAWNCPILGALQFNLHATLAKSGQLIIKNLSFVQNGTGGGGIPVWAAFNNVGTDLIEDNFVIFGSNSIQVTTVPLANVKAWGNGQIFIGGNDVRINQNFSRGWPGTAQTGVAGVPDPTVISATANSITLSSVPPNVLLGENLADLGDVDNIPDGCVVTSVSGTTLGTSCTNTAVAGEYVMISSYGLNFYAPDSSQYYPGAGGHFGLNINDSRYLGFSSGGMAFFANSGVGIQGIKIAKTGVG